MIADAIGYLQRRDPVIEGQGSDAGIIPIFCMLHDLAISEERAVELVMGHLHTAKEDGEPFDEGWLEAKAASAYRSARNEFGCRYEPPPRPAAETFKDYTPADAEPAPQAEATDADDGPVGFDTIWAEPVQPIRDIIPGLIEKGVTNLLTGPADTFKSWLALQWGLCVAAGKPIWDRPVEQCTFIHLSAEDDRNEINRRSVQIRDRLGLPRGLPAQCWDLKTNRLGPLLGITDSAITELPFGHRLRAYLKGIEGHKFIVGDSSYNLLRFADGVRINEDQVNAAIQWLDQFCADTNSTLVTLTTRPVLARCAATLAIRPHGIAPRGSGSG